MQKVTARFLPALINTHQIATRFELWTGIGGEHIADLKCDGGGVTEDIANAIRRQLTGMTVTDDDGSLIAGGLLTPYGPEIRPYRGVTYPDGSTELVQIGAYGITDVDAADDPNDFIITIIGADRSDKVSRNKFRDYYTIAAGSDLGVSIQNGIRNQVPELDHDRYFDFVSTAGILTPLVTFQPGDDPWVGLQTLATNAGYDLYFDSTGTCILEPIIDPSQQLPVYSYVDDSAVSIMERLDTRLTNRQVFNHIIMTSAGTGVATPLRAESWDSNPASPTFIGYNYSNPSWTPTAYGDVLDVRSISTATTQAQLQSACDAALRQALGLTKVVTLNAVPNPAHLVNDVVTLTRARSALSRLDVIFDTVTIPFTTDGQLVATLRLVV